MIIAREAWDEMWEHCATEAPNEAVGALLGHDGRVTAVQPLKNVSRTPRVAYDADPMELALLYSAVDEVGGPVDVLGFYHSHPRTDAAPSPADLAMAHPGAVYVICSLGPHTAGQAIGFLAGGELVEVHRG